MACSLFGLWLEFFLTVPHIRLSNLNSELYDDFKLNKVGLIMGYAWLRNHVKTSWAVPSSKIHILAQDLVRRLLNTKENLPSTYKGKIVDGYAQKILNGDYSRDQTRRIIVAGLKGYHAKLRRMRERGQVRIHLTAEESRGARLRKKLLGKCSWFRDRKGKD